MLTRTIYVGNNTMFQILNREMAAQVTSDYPYAVISIVSSEAKDAVLAESPHCQAVLRLRFDAIDEPMDDLILFDAGFADRILDFFQTTRDKITLFIIHCEQGINRSAAVGAALSRIINGEDGWFFKRYEPLVLVYELLLERWHLRQIKVGDHGTSKIIIPVAVEAVEAKRSLHAGYEIDDDADPFADLTDEEEEDVDEV